MNGNPLSKLSLDGMNGLAFGVTNAPKITQFDWLGFWLLG